MSDLLANGGGRVFGIERRLSGNEVEDSVGYGVLLVVDETYVLGVDDVTLGICADIAVDGEVDHLGNEPFDDVGDFISKFCQGSVKVDGSNDTQFGRAVGGFVADGDGSDGGVEVGKELDTFGGVGLGLGVLDDMTKQAGKLFVGIGDEILLVVDNGIGDDGREVGATVLVLGQGGAGGDFVGGGCLVLLGGGIGDDGLCVRLLQG